MKIATSALVLAIMCLAICHCSFGQHETEGEHQEHEETEHHRHSISVEIGHSHLSKGVRNGEKTWLTVPSWAINYNYHFNHQWSLGLHNDIVIEEFEISEHEEVVERSYPLSMVAVAIYKPLHYLGIVGGAGFEYAPEETFTLVRIGLEPSVEISHKWELIFSIVYDMKINGYNSWSMGAGVARLF